MWYRLESFGKRKGDLRWRKEGRQAGWPTDISNAPEESDKTKDFVNAKRSHRKGEKVREFRKQPVSQSVSSVSVLLVMLLLGSISQFRLPAYLISLFCSFSKAHFGCEILDGFD